MAAWAPHPTQASGALEDAEAILAVHPQVSSGGISIAAILGESGSAEYGG